MDAAAAEIYERGVAGTSLDDVCAAAGVGRSQLYHYFSDKSALVSAVIAAQTERILAGQVGLDTWEGWRRWRDMAVEMLRERHFAGGCPIGSLASELADHDETARSALADGFEGWEAALRVGLTSMRDHGLLDADADPASLALATLATMQGGVLLSRTRKEAGPLEAALDAALAHLRAHAAGASRM